MGRDLDVVHDPRRGDAWPIRADGECESAGLNDAVDGVKGCLADAAAAIG
jgi:hypothetical protein